MQNTNTIPTRTAAEARCSSARLAACEGKQKGGSGGAQTSDSEELESACSKADESTIQGISNPLPRKRFRFTVDLYQLPCVSEHGNKAQCFGLWCEVLPYPKQEIKNDKRVHRFDSNIFEGIYACDS